MSLGAGLAKKVPTFVKTIKNQQQTFKLSFCKQNHNATSCCLPWIRQANRPTCCLKEEKKMEGMNDVFASRN